MPYIPPHERRALNVGGPPVDAGQLNYKITDIVDEYLGETPNYSAYNEAIGVLECAKLELYRRRVAIYEDKKLKLNGEVYHV